MENPVEVPPKKKPRNAETSGLQCYAIGCYTYRNAVTKRQGISFHSFPDKVEEETRYNVWVRNCRRDIEPGKCARLCSKHFKEEWLVRSAQRTHLKPDAIPTIFNVPERLQYGSPEKRTTKVSQAAMAPPRKAEPEPTEGQVSISMEHSYGIPSIERQKEKVEYLTGQNEELRKKLRNATLREKKAKKTVADLLSQLKEVNLVNAELELKLLSFKDIPCDLFKKPSHEYTESQKNFALTLHLYSAKAYNYLRDTVKMNLPAPRSLRKWLESVNGEPGLNRQMIDVLKLKVKENPLEYTHCCFMLDAMAIKQLVQFDQKTQRHFGYVDLGNGPQEDPAKEVLVLLVVGLRGHWKAPIGYFVTKTLNAETQAQLVYQALDQLSEIGMKVRTITMDGHATNVATAKILGADLRVESMKPYVEVSGCKSYIIFDPCHMIKLARNTLHDYGGFNSPFGQVLWQHIAELKSTQDSIGLRLGNRLTKDHIHYTTQKMKVSLAVQVLSESVASALQTVRMLGMPNFMETKATEEFIRHIDRLFDIMNSRSAFGKGWKAPICKDNWQLVKQQLLATREYLLSLKLGDTPLHQTPRFFVNGLCADITSILSLAEDIVNDTAMEMKYILTYKMSQDHIELFFSAVRQCGGWMNNPTALQFKYIYRRLCARSGALNIPRGANVSSQDTTSLLSSYVPSVAAAETSSDEEDLIHTLLDHAYNKQCSLGLLVSNVVAYISGWVVKKVLPRISCSCCKECLVSVEASVLYRESLTLLHIKDHGRLISPSDGVITILMSAERHLRELTGLKVTKLHHLMLERLVLADVEPDTLNMGRHALETTAGIDNHFFDLVRALTRVFFNLRSYHIVRLHNESEQSEKLRAKYTKLLLFRVFKPVTSRDVAKIIMRSPTKSSSQDPIPTWLLKDTLHAAVSPIRDMINASFQASTVPALFKSARITPFLKSRGLDWNNFNSYRPVSNMSFLSKVLERVVAKQLTEYLDAHGFHEERQSAYRTDHSTETALLRVYNDALLAADQGKTTVLIMLDLSAAFDTLDHEILVERLHTRYGISAGALQWFKSYMSERTQAVSINGVTSSFTTLKYGVPQGSVLGPVLFSLYMAPLGDIIRGYQLQHMFYADDSQIYFTIEPNRSDQVTHVHRCINDIRDWMVFNKLKLNDQKTEVIHFSSRFRSIPVATPSIHIGPVAVEPSPCVRI